MIVANVEHARGVGEGALHLRPGGVPAGVDDAAAGMPALAGKRPPALRRFVETGTVADQVGDGAITVGHDRAHRRGVAQPATGGDRVGDVGVDRIVGIRQHHRDSTLRVVGGGITCP